MTTAQKDRKEEMQTSSVYYGDCLKHLTHWNNWNQWREVGREEAVRRMLTDRKLADLIYLDPPWNSDEDHNNLYETPENKERGFTAQTTAFTDTWEWGDAAAERLKRLTKDYFSQNDPFYPLAAERLRNCIAGLELALGRDSMLAYITYMAERLAFCRELLKDTGSIYLHCDPYASHSLKLVMDAIFGENNFRREIIWAMPRPSGFKTRAQNWIRGHDTILYYAKDAGVVRFNKQYEPYPEEYIKKHFKKSDEQGPYWLRDGRKRRLGEGFNLHDTWTDIHSMQTQSVSRAENRGYKTQKPLKLLKRIIQASTNEGDIVLDPFCGCGTTMIAAHELKRKFIGIDLSLFTVQSVVRKWLEEEHVKNIRIAGIPEDLASARQLAIDDPFAFETFAIELCHPAFVANKEQRGDGGTDGRGFLLQPVKEKGKWKHEVLVQVKGGKNGPSLDKVSRFARDIERSKTAIAGVFITVEQKHWTAEMKKIAREMGRFEHPDGRKYPRLQHWYLKRADLRAREETMLDGLPNLPALLGLNKKALIPKQSDFAYWKHTEEDEI